MFPDPEETPISDDGEGVTPPAFAGGAAGTEAPAQPAQADQLPADPMAHVPPPADPAGDVAATSSPASEAAAAALGPPTPIETAPITTTTLPAIPTPLPPPPAPKPKAPIRPERTVGASGETAWRTDGILVERAAPRAFFITISPPQRAPQRVYVHEQAFNQLLHLANAPSWDTGKLWRALCDIPLERPLPSRRLEEELRALLTAFSTDFR